MPAEPVTGASLPPVRPLPTLVESETMGHAQDAHGQVKSVAKAAKVLRCFDSGTVALTVRDIAARTGLPRSTCHAICSTLVAENLLETRSGGGYVLGVEMMVMGGHVITRSGLVDAATPVMNGLAAATHGEVHLAQLDDDGDVVYLHRVRVCRHMKARNWFGLRVPAHTTGCGKAALSRIEPSRVREMVTAGGATGDEADQLAAELDVARTTGFVVNTTFQAGLASVAAPIVRWDGHVLGALSVADRRETFSRQRIASLGVAVRDAASTVSRQLVGPARVS